MGNPYTGSNLHCDDKGKTFSLEQEYYCGDKWIAPKLVSPVPDAMVQILKPVQTYSNSAFPKTAPPTGYWTYTVEPDQFGTFPAVRTVLPYCEDLISSLETVTGALVIG